MKFLEPEVMEYWRFGVSREGIKPSDITTVFQPSEINKHSKAHTEYFFLDHRPENFLFDFLSPLPPALYSQPSALSLLLSALSPLRFVLCALL